MRDILITLFVLGMLPFILKRPYIGILVWSWLSYMNPHRYTWGFAYSFPFAQIVAIVTIISIVLAGKKLRLGSGAFFPVWAIFLVWMGVTTLNAMYPEYATIQYIKVLKIQFVILLTVLLIDNKEKLIQMLWVVALSVGYFGVKGGVFTLQTAGAYRVWGPPDSFIRDNNELGLALLMVIPLFYFLYGFYQNPKLRFALVICMLLIAISVVGTQSRGCLLAGGAVVGYLWWHSQKKIPAMIALLVVVAGLLAFAPDTWYERMGTISEYEEDGSAMGRINSWWYAFNVANDNITGAGFDSYSKGSFAIYAPDPDDVHAAHSIYFGVLADHGWIGLTFFLLLLWISWRNASWLIQSTAGVEHLFWVNSLSRMIKVSMIAYLSGGVFYSLSYFDLPWHLMAVLLILRKIVAQEASVEGIAASENSGPSGVIAKEQCGSDDVYIK